jgi:hypothetical protein
MTTRRALSRICLISSLFAFFLFSAAPARAVPQVEAMLDAATVSTGTPFTLSITVSWQGDADQYIIVPPEPELPDGIEKLSSSFVSSASADMQTMNYSFVLRARNTGQYTIQPAQVKYWPRGEEKESTAASGEINFKAVRFALIENNTTLIACICSVLLAGVGAALVFIMRRKKIARRKDAAADGGTEVHVRVAELLQVCRQCKLRGDHAGFCAAALDLALMAAPQETALIDNLAAMLEKVRFGGLLLTAEEIERLLRQLEKNADGLL